MLTTCKKAQRTKSDSYLAVMLAGAFS